jgi:hypothetical protein
MIFLAYRTGYSLSLNSIVLHVWWLLPTFIKYKNYSSITLQSLLEVYRWYLKYILSCLLRKIAFYYLYCCMHSEWENSYSGYFSTIGKGGGLWFILVFNYTLSFLLLLNCVSWVTLQVSIKSSFNLTKEQEFNLEKYQKFSAYIKIAIT